MADEPPENKTQHLHLLMAPGEVEAIDDWGFKNRIRTRAEAIRRLCQIGIRADQSLDNLLLFIETAQGWANAAFDETPSNPSDTPTDQPAPLAKQFTLFTTMALLMAQTAALELKQDRDRLKTLDDIEKLMSAAEADPELEDAYALLSEFWETWKAKYPGKAFRLAKDDDQRT
jgi:hypothetical protein